VCAALALGAGGGSPEPMPNTAFWGAGSISFFVMTVGSTALYWDMAVNRVAPGRQRRLWDGVAVFPAAVE